MIYWNTETSQYFEESTSKRHICPNRNQNMIKPPNVASTPQRVYTPYKKKEGASKEPVSNSFEYLEGHPRTVRSEYNYLSDLISKGGGRVHGSQSHVSPDGMLKILIYFEVPEGKRDEVHVEFSKWRGGEPKY